MSTSKLVEMPDGQNVQTVFFPDKYYYGVERDQLRTHLLNFWSYVRLNPMVAFETEWSNSKVVLLKLCNLNNMCLILPIYSGSINSQNFPELRRFFAVKEIKFVGVNISRDLELLREDYGIEIRNAVELSKLAADRWNEFCDIAPLDRQYEEWDDYKLVIPAKLGCEQKISPGMFGLAFLSAAIAGMKISSIPPHNMLTEGPIPRDSLEDVKLDFHYQTLSVYAALKVGIKLFECKIKL